MLLFPNYVVWVCQAKPIFLGSALLTQPLSEGASSHEIPEPG